MAELRADPMVTRTYPVPADAIEAYLRFIYLAAVMPKGAVPNKAVDAVWHAHLSHTRSYSEFCRTTVRRFIHHNPGPRTDSGPDQATRDRFRDTQEAERREFSQVSLEARDGPGPAAAWIVGGVALVIAVSVISRQASPGAVGVLIAVTAVVATIASLVAILHLMTQYSATEAQPAGHPAKRKSETAAGGDGGSGGAEVFFLSGQSGNTTADGCGAGSTTAEACALDGGTDGNGGHSGDGSDGSSCSSCGGGGD